MPAPAVAAILAFVGRQGVTQAVKKFGKKAVDQAMKANRKVDERLSKAQGVTSKTPGRTSKKDGISVGKKRTQADRNNQRIKAGTAGLAAGYGVGQVGGNSNSSGSKAKSPPNAKAKIKAKNSRANPSDYPTYRKNTKSAVSFREAQRAAKRKDQKTFTWEGRRYNTKEK